MFCPEITLAFGREVSHSTYYFSHFYLSALGNKKADRQEEAKELSPFYRKAALGVLSCSFAVLS